MPSGYEEGLTKERNLWPDSMEEAFNKEGYEVRELSHDRIVELWMRFDPYNLKHNGLSPVERLELIMSPSKMAIRMRDTLSGFFSAYSDLTEEEQATWRIIPKGVTLSPNALHKVGAHLDRIVEIVESSVGVLGFAGEGRIQQISGLDVRCLIRNVRELAEELYHPTGQYKFVDVLEFERIVYNLKNPLYPGVNNFVGIYMPRTHFHFKGDGGSLVRNRRFRLAFESGQERLGENRERFNVIAGVRSQDGSVSRREFFYDTNTWKELGMSAGLFEELDPDFIDVLSIRDGEEFPQRKFESAIAVGISNYSPSVSPSIVGIATNYALKMILDSTA